MTRSLSTIAQEILADWKNPSPYAVPYLNAMMALDMINDNYHVDSVKSVVLYFLSNAASWRGEAARRIKAELRSLTNG